MTIKSSFTISSFSIISYNLGTDKSSYTISSFANSEINQFVKNLGNYTGFDSTVLKGLWAFETGLKDTSGNSNDGTIGVGTEKYINGYFGYAFDFNGLNNIRTVSTPFDFEKTTPFSVAFWVKPGIGNTTFPTLTAKISSDVSTNNGFLVYWGRDTQQIGFKFDDGGALYDQNSGVLQAPAGVWSHVVVTFSGNSNRNGKKIYVNGVVTPTQTSVAITGTLSNTQPLTIGSNGNNTGKFIGQMDEVMVFNKELSSSEVITLLQLTNSNQNNYTTGSFNIGHSSTESFTIKSFDNNYIINRFQTGLPSRKSFNNTWFTALSFSLQKTPQSFSGETATGQVKSYSITSYTMGYSYDPGFSSISFTRSPDRGLVHTTDSLIVKTKTLVHTTDSFILKTQTNTHTTDSFILKTQTLTHTTDSLLLKTEILSHTTDSLIAKTRIKIHTTDSFILKSQIIIHTTDSLILKTQTKTHTTDSLIAKTKTLIHTTDSFILKTQIRAHTTDSLILKKQTKTHNTDSYITILRTLTHNTDSFLFRRPTITHSTDSLLFQRILIQKRNIILPDSKRQVGESSSKQNIKLNSSKEQLVAEGS